MAAEKTTKEEEKTLAPTAEIKANIALIERGVAELEPRFTHRVLRSLIALRKRIDNKVLRDAIEENYPAGACFVYLPILHEVTCVCREDSAVKSKLLSCLPPAPVTDRSMDVDSTPESKVITETPPKVTVDPVPEVEIYLRLLIIHHLYSAKETYAESIQICNETVEKMQSLNRRSMDPIAAKVWFAVERSYELGGELADARPYVLPFPRALRLLKLCSVCALECFWPLSALPHCATTTIHKPLLSIACFETIFITTYTTKQINWFPKLLSLRLPVTLSSPATTISWAV